MSKIKTLGIKSESWIKFRGEEVPSVFEELLYVTCNPFLWVQWDAFPQVPCVDGESRADRPEQEPEAAPLSPLLGKPLSVSLYLCRKSPKGLTAVSESPYEPLSRSNSKVQCCHMRKVFHMYWRMEILQCPMCRWSWPEPAPLLGVQPVPHSAAQLPSGGVTSLQLLPELRYKPLRCCRKCKLQINSFSTYLKPINIVAVFQSGSTALR